MMITLKQPSEPYELALPYGVKVTVKPLTSAGMALAQAKARGCLSEDEAEEGQYQLHLIDALAKAHIISWSGIEGEPAVNDKNIVALMALYPVGERFFTEFTLKQILLNSAKNA